MVTILMMLVKVVTLGLLKIKIVQNKGYDVINKTLSRESNYSVDVVMWPKFGKSSIPVWRVVITSIL